MTEQKTLVVREEPFGYTVSDRRTLRHRFLLEKEFDSFLKKQGLTKGDCEFLPTTRKNFRQDLVYSPIRIYYELTLACNMCCKFCFCDAGIPRRDELTTQEVIDSLQQFREENVIGIRFTGGELILRLDWYEILRTAKDLGFIVSINTNATHFTPETRKKLVSLDLEQITISVDGKREHHNQNRGKGNYKRAVKNLKFLSEAGAHLRINTLLSRYSLGDLEHMAALANKYVDEINFFTVRFMGRGAELEDQYSITWKEFYNFAEKAKRVRKKYPNLRLLTFCQTTNRKSVDSQRKRKLGLKMGTTSGITTFNVASDGRYFAGGYVPYINPKWSLGNVKKDNVFEVWQNNSKLEKMRNMTGALKRFCEKCLEWEKRCPGPVFETELYRAEHPGSKNLYCIYGEDFPLLTKLDIYQSPED